MCRVQVERKKAAKRLLLEKQRLQEIEQQIKESEMKNGKQRNASFVCTASFHCPDGKPSPTVKVSPKIVPMKKIP